MPEVASTDRLALVTGASGTIGSAIARRLARDGAAVLVHFDSNKGGADATVAAIREAGGRAEALRCDLGAPRASETLFALADRCFGGAFAGRIDVLVNNAGIFDAGPLVEVTDDDFDRVFDVNVRAVFTLSREAAKRMIAAGSGRIVNVGSVFGESVPAAGLSVYSASKFAVRGLTRAWSRELGPHGITVNAVEPALVQAEPVPARGPAVEAMERFSSVGRFGRGDDVAEAVAFFASPSSGYVNGQNLPVDGGWTA